jgi:hypothetical protein
MIERFKYLRGIGEQRIFHINLEMDHNPMDEINQIVRIMGENMGIPVHLFNIDPIPNMGHNDRFNQWVNHTHQHLQEILFR